MRKAKRAAIRSRRLGGGCNGGRRTRRCEMNGDEYLERVRKLVPAFRERDALTERTRRLPDESWADFQRAQLLRALQPARWGGFELHPAALYRAVMEVGAACPSTAWVLGVLGVHSWQLAAFPERAQQEVWGADSTVQAYPRIRPRAGSSASRAASKERAMVVLQRMRFLPLGDSGRLDAQSRRHARRAQLPAAKDRLRDR